MTTLLQANEEKNAGKRYVGQIDFESQIFADSTPIPRKVAASKPSHDMAESMP